MGLCPASVGLFFFAAASKERQNRRTGNGDRTWTDLVDSTLLRSCAVTLSAIRSATDGPNQRHERHLGAD
jgi:hypothetical protein